MAARKPVTQNAPKQITCNTHGKPMRVYLVLPGRKIEYRCDDGCAVNKAEARRLRG